MRNIRIEASACIWWAVLLMILPLRWLIAAWIAGAFHELCHYLVIRALGEEVEGIVIRNTGAYMITSPLPPLKELLCALSGPVCSMLLFLFADFLPVTTLCVLVQSAFNLLPIFPLDGGRAFRAAARIIWPNKNTEKLCHFSGLLCAVVLCTCFFAAIWRFSIGFGAVLPVVILAQSFFPGKRPCKTANLALQ